MEHLIQSVATCIFMWDEQVCPTISGAVAMHFPCKKARESHLCHCFVIVHVRHNGQDPEICVVSGVFLSSVLTNGFIVTLKWHKPLVSLLKHFSKSPFQKNHCEICHPHFQTSVLPFRVLPAFYD